MQIKSGQCKTFALENQFSIVCPVFGVTTRLAPCFVLRDAVWRGERIEVRKGCQVAMHACKCPINQIVKDVARTGEDPYHSATPVLGSLDKELLDRISPVLVPERALNSAELTPRERELLVTANEKARAGVTLTSPAAPRKPKTIDPLPKVESPPTSTVQAAITGDLASAVSLTPEEVR